MTRRLLACAALAAAILATYANSFKNDFHFDDEHTVVGNPFIRELRNTPRFFADAKLSSTMPDHAVYRPVVMASLALDYRLGRGLKPLWFHLSTLAWFMALAILMFFLFHRIMEAADPHPANAWTALFAAACFALHPANAETVNYVIQRADIYCTLGVVASLLWFAAFPAQRKWGWYLLPAVAAFLSKPPALVFPFLLLAYVVLFEREGLRRALRFALPALLTAGAAAVLIARMTPASFDAGGPPAWLYRLTQPWVALHYFKSFFLPTELSADTDWTVLAPLGTEAIAGYVFILGLLTAGHYAARKRETRPIAFGILWFLVALAPTSLMPLAEVTNDHRMFFPFVGLALAVVWSLRLLLFRKTDRLWVRGTALGMAAALAAFAAGTRERNRVWRTEESLWRDVSIKSPRNGRGLMNYGLTFMARGDYSTALDYFERATEYAPNYWTLEINLGIANGGLRRDAEAEEHFQRAISLAPAMADPYFFYARWLNSVGRSEEAAAQLEVALRINPLSFDSRDLLNQIRTDAANPQPPAAPPSLKEQAAAALLELSLQQYRAGRFEDCVASAKRAIEDKPDYPEAYNNMAAAYNSLKRWDEGIQAASVAIRLKPDFQLAKNNLAWAISQKQKAAGGR